MSELQKVTARTPLGGRLARLREMASRLPGADIAAEIYQSVEQQALSELKHRLDAMEGPRAKVPETSSSALAKRTHPRVLLTALLDDAADQSHTDACRGFYTSLLLQLTSDEACMLAALSDGTEYPLIHIVVGSGIGGNRRVAGNFSSVGRGATIKLRDYVPAYVGHLLSLGLAERGPADKEQETRYQILEGDGKVQAIVKRLSTQHRVVRFQREVLRISDLGRDLWNYCDPSQEEK